jgi:hypothetical protein
VPILLDLAFAYRPVDEPAEVSGSEFPSRALSLALWGTLSCHPASLAAFPGFLQFRKQKKDLSFRVNRNFSPSLLIAMNGFDGCPQKISHLLLGLTQFLASSCKFFVVYFSLLMFVLGPSARDLCQKSLYHKVTLLRLTASPTLVKAFLHILTRNSVTPIPLMIGLLELHLKVHFSILSKHCAEDYISISIVSWRLLIRLLEEGSVP